MDAPFLLPPSQQAVNSPGSSVFDLPVQTSTIPISRHESDLYIPQPTATDEHSAKYIMISGGTGGNAICTAFGKDCAFVLPVSDDGGSSAEIIRVLGGPSVGDVRSRLVRLIPQAPVSSPLCAIRNLLSHRLSAQVSELIARQEWRDIVEGRSSLWARIPSDRKETIRGFLVYFENEVLRRAHKDFSFVNGSVGNYFLAAAQSFFRSMPSAIFLFSSITSSQANILPCIVTNHTVTIGAVLENEEKLIGQCEISHPVRSLSVEDEARPSSPFDGMGETIASRPHNSKFEASAKGEYEVLTSPIQRLFYLNAYGHEVHPSPNPEYLTGLGTRDALVYSCGSLWTSIMPPLCLKGVAQAIAKSRTLKAKILLLNGENDRETHGYKGSDYVIAIARTLNTNYSKHSTITLGNVHTSYPISAFVTDLVYLKNTLIKVDVSRITELGVRCREVEGMRVDGGTPRYTAACVRDVVADIMRNYQKGFC